MTIQEKINKRGQEYIAGLRNTVKKLWRSCCEFDDIPVDSKFVVFSNDNKYVPFYNQAMGLLQEAINQYKAGGYVGLTLSNTL